MATRNLVLGSAASLLIAGAILAAAPVMAQSGDPAQAYSSAKAQYDSALEDYNRKQQAYERQRSDYNDRIYDYQRSLDAPPRLPDAAAIDDPDPDVVVLDGDRDTTVILDDDLDDRTVIIRDDDPDLVVVDRDDFVERLAIRNVPPLMRLEDVVDVNNELFNAPVLDSQGLQVGHFRRIETKVPGDLVAVITLDGSRRTISMLTEHVRADPSRRTIISDLTTREIERIPSGFPHG